MIHTNKVFIQIYALLLQNEQHTLRDFPTAKYVYEKQMKAKSEQ